MSVLYVMIGLPGSGKSTVASKIKEIDVVYSSDKIREELYGDANDQTHNGEVFRRMFELTRQSLREGKNVVYDATNLSSRRRMALLKDLHGGKKNYLDFTAIAVMCICPYSVCVDRASHRERVVFERVIKRMMSSFCLPTQEEGFDRITYEITYDQPINAFIDNIDQQNHHHSLKLVDHMNKARKLAEQMGEEDIICSALAYHDWGKIYTQSFDETGEAHYYGHQHSSAYLYLCYGAQEIHFYADDALVDEYWEKVLNTTLIIQHHMDPYNGGVEKLSSPLREWVIKAHKYDENAH